MGEYPPEAARLTRQVVALFSDPESFPGRAIPPHIAALLGIEAAISTGHPPSPGPTDSVREEVPQERKSKRAA